MTLPMYRINVDFQVSAKEVIQFITLKLVDGATPISREAIAETMQSHLWAGGVCYLETRYQNKVKQYEEETNQSSDNLRERAERIARKFFPELFEHCEALSVSFIKSEV